MNDITHTPILYNWNPNSPNPQYIKSTSPNNYYSWAAKAEWLNSGNVCIKYYNDTGQPLKFTEIQLRVVSCNSGGASFWSDAGIAAYADGSAADYELYLRVEHTTGSVETSSTLTDSVGNVNYNMNTPGTDKYNTAKFGEPPFTGNEALQYRKYTVSDCPTINPGDTAYVHFYPNNLQNLYTSYIRFIMNPLDMVIKFNIELGPYIWRFCEDGKWHLVRPVQLMTGNGWTNVEDDMN